MIRLLFAFLALLTLRAQAQELLFSHVGNKGERMQDAINALYQDEFGFLWFGTNNGIKLWDGLKITSFKATLGDMTGLVTNNIRTICGDKNGHLFIVNSGTLLQYDLHKETFSHLRRGGVSQVAHGSSGLWVAHSGDIYLYDIAGRKFTKYVTLNTKSSVGGLLEASNGCLYVGVRRGGLYVIDRNGKKTHILDSKNVCSIYEDKHKNVWVCTTDDGLYCINPNMSISHLSHSPSNNHSLPNNNIRTIRQDNLGNYWIGTAHGLVHYNPSQQSFKTYRHSEFDPYSLSGSSIWALEIDNQGSLWIGSYYGGVDIINPEYSFCHYYRKKYDDSGITGSTVSAVCEDDKGDLWVGTENGGLNLLNRATEQFTAYPNPLSSLALNIKALLYDKPAGVLWVGTYGGFYRFDLKRHTFSRVHLSDNDDANTFIRQLRFYQGKVLVGSRNMIHLYDPKSNKAINFLEQTGYKQREMTVWDILVDGKERVWASNFSGVTYYDPLKKIWVSRAENRALSSICKIQQSALTEDRNGGIWSGSIGGGVTYINARADSVYCFNSQNSDLPDNDILAISESPSGYIIIGTSQGVSVLDPKTRNISNYQNNVFFPFSQINEKGVTVTKSGDIVISSFSGMYMMRERDLNQKAKDFEVIFTHLYVNNTKVVADDHLGILSESLPYSKSIILRDDHTIVSVEYAVSNYIGSRHHRVEYKLEGFNSEWVATEDRNLITFTNLSPGEYTLYVRATVDDTTPMVRQRQLVIKVLPSIWSTTLAYILYLVVGGAVLFVILYNYTSRIKLQTSLKFSQKERVNIEEMNQSKLKFFTQISHEFRTPITLIASQLDLVLQGGDIPQNIYRRLLSVVKNVERVKSLIGELMDFRKQEQGFMQPKMGEYELVNFLECIYLSFKEYANTQQISLSYIHKPEQIMVWFDHAQMEKVFYNLIFNALKFTPQHGCVSVLVEHLHESVTISIIDSGVGIASEDIPKIFTQFFQGENTKQMSAGTGIGLALSRNIVVAHQGTISVDSVVSKGTTFCVTLPLGDKHIAPEQKVNAEQHIESCFEDTQMPDDDFLEEIRSSQRQRASTDTSILIVEDNIELLEILEQIFEPLYRVHKAENGEQGYRMARELQPDLVLSDVMMPLVSGSQMCSMIKSNNDTSHIPVVLLTARTSVDKMLEGLLTGADDYITKPFHIKLLVTRCHNLINGRRMMQQLYSNNPQVEAHQLTTNPYDQQLLEKAVSVIENNLTNEQFDVNVFAREMCMGRTNLFEKIRGITGSTPNNLIASIRMKSAMKLLMQQTQYSIEEVALRSGYVDHTYFIRQFKKIYGMTPLQYRKQHKTL